MAIPLALIMAAAGMAKNEMVDKPEAEKKRQTEAQLTRWSPWTGIKGQTVYDPSTVNAGIQGGFQGYSLGQNIEDRNDAKNYRNKMLSLWSYNPNTTYAGNSPGPWSNEG